MKLAVVTLELPSLAETLRELGKKLYRRLSGREDRIKNAIEEGKEALTVMRLCHLIISTQLDAPANWYYEVERLGPLGSILLVVNTAATVVEGGGMVVTSEVAMLGMLALGVFGVASVAGLATVFSIYFRKHSNRNEFNPQLLEMSMKALGATYPSPYAIAESSITDLVRDDMDRSGSKETLQKWQRKLKRGLEGNSMLKGSFSINPTIYWAQQLFILARVGQLRGTMASQIRIGVEGPTEIGKSELLTTLIGADESLFRSGSGMDSRTMDI